MGSVLRMARHLLTRSRVGGIPQTMLERKVRMN